MNYLKAASLKDVLTSLPDDTAVIAVSVDNPAVVAALVSLAKAEAQDSLQTFGSLRDALGGRI